MSEDTLTMKTPQSMKDVQHCGLLFISLADIITAYAQQQNVYMYMICRSDTLKNVKSNLATLSHLFCLKALDGSDDGVCLGGGAWEVWVVFPLTFFREVLNWWV